MSAHGQGGNDVAYSNAVDYNKRDSAGRKFYDSRGNCFGVLCVGNSGGVYRHADQKNDTGRKRTGAPRGTGKP